jgi:hypothetical protein
VVLQHGGIGDGLTTPHHKKKTACYEMPHRVLDLNLLFEMTLAMENGYEIRNTGC